MAGISESEVGDRPVFRLELVFGPSPAVTSGEEDPVKDASVGSDEDSAADVS